MNLQEAIEILSLDKTCDFEGNSQDLGDAIQLGIEAIEREEERRRFAVPDKVNLLPSETKE